MLANSYFLPRLRFARVLHLTYGFDASLSTDDKAVVSYAWDFAGTAVRGSSAVHTFADTGQYLVSLTVTDAMGLSAQAKRLVSVTSLSPVAAQRFLPMPPCRAFDSRLAASSAMRNGVERVIDLVNGVCKLPPGSASVALTATVLASATSGEGFLQLGPNNSAPMTASVLNFASGRTPRSNSTVVQLSAGAIKAASFTSGGGPVEVILDITGVFTSDPKLSAKALNFNVLTPCRLLDSSESQHLSFATPVIVKVGARCGTPASAAAAALNLVVAGATGEGNLRLYPSGSTAPWASALTFQSWTLPQANSSLAALSLDATRSVRLQLDGTANAQVMLDTTGYFDAAAPLAFHPVAPCSAFNTLDADSGEARLQNGVRRELQIQGNCGIPLGARAVLLNFSVITPDGSGTLSAFASDQKAPPLSAVLYFAASEPDEAPEDEAPEDEAPEDEAPPPSAGQAPDTHF